MSLTVDHGYVVDIARPITDGPLGIEFVKGDALTHQISVTINNNGAPVDLTDANAMVYVVRRDKETVTNAATVDGNAISALLHAESFAITGRIYIIARVTIGTATITVLYRYSSVRDGTTDVFVDPGEAIPSIDTLLAQIAAMEAATALANAAAANANATMAANMEGIPAVTYLPYTYNDEQKRDIRANIFGLYGGTLVTDFDTIVVTGFYTGYGAATGAPNNSTSWYVNHINSNVGTVSAVQIAYAYTTTEMYIRRKTASTWGAWASMASGGGTGGGGGDNLLINGYFPTPINTRAIVSGATQSTAGYVLDMWKLISGSLVWTTASGVALASGAVIRQYMERLYQNLLGKTVTFTTRLSDGTYKTVSGAFPSSVSGATVETTLTLTGVGTVKIGFEYRATAETMMGTTSNYVPYVTITASGAVTLVHAKLELGSSSTLSTDAQPDYADELAKCQRYLVEMSLGGSAGYYDGGARFFAISLMLPCAMRKLPTIVNTAAYATFVYGSSFAQNVTITSVISISGSLVRLRFNSTATSAYAVIVSAEPHSTVILSAEL